MAFFTCLSTELISGQWVSYNWPLTCTDRGPDNRNHHDYTGYNQICCLSNMILLRADVHLLWDAYKIGVDTFVSPPTP